MSTPTMPPAPTGDRLDFNDQLTLDGTGPVVPGVKLTRAQRMSMPLARDVLRQVAIEHGACIRPIQLRRENLDTGQVDPVFIPCRATTEDKCPPCAKRNKALRTAQCREGWHLEHEPVTPAPEPSDYQKWSVLLRAETQAARDDAAAGSEPTDELDASIAALDGELSNSGVRGSLGPAGGTPQRKRRHRSTRRRQDAPDLPKRKMDPRTVGKTYTAPDGATFRPSLFLTFTCPSYGPVHAVYPNGRPCGCGQRHRSDDSVIGTPVDPDSYDYARAARDLIAFPALFDRLMQNLRRYCGHNLQYFAAVEPQRRLAPHVHIALRGTITRAEIRRVLAATYHQVWWSQAAVVRFDGDQLPAWDEATGRYIDPATGELLSTWDQALDGIGPNDEPYHVARFGTTFDAKGVLAASPDSDRCIGYLTKYLTKNVADCHEIRGDAQREHAARLVAALEYLPCSPTCANWLRYGIQPKDAKAGLVPGCCKGKAHKVQHLGYAGRRVWSSGSWSGKTLDDHRAERKAWLTRTLGISATALARYRWQIVTPDDDDFVPIPRRLMHLIAERQQTAATVAQAQRAAGPHDDHNLSATEHGRAA